MPAKPLTANASPTREFFVSMLTRDISLQDCILDLIDNCLDGARRSIGEHAIDDPSEQAYQGYKCEIALTRQKFEISDNCGGIPIDLARNSAFRFGRDHKVRTDKYGVGLYGIGLKRAVFKLGRHAEVHSVTASDAFRVVIDVDSWLRDRDAQWSFPMVKEAKSGKPGTRIEVRSLNASVGEEFASAEFPRSLARTIGRDFAFFLSRGFTIKINNDSVRPSRFEMRRGEGFEPARLRYKDEAGVNVEIFAGMAAAPPDDEIPSGARPSRDMDASGWYVLCNERTILAADRTERTVWGYAGVPDWHNQYNGFMGLVFFRSRDPGKLPWTTTKRDVDMASEVYRRALRHMRTLTKDWISYTNKRKRDLDQARKAENKTRPVPIFSIGRRHALVLPKGVRAARTLVNILYQRPSARVDRVREALGNSSLSNREVGEKTFEYFYEREIDE